MREQRLLERISSRQQEPGKRTKEDPRRTVDSVLSHLQRILNTRQGSVPIGEDYGVPDFTDLATAYPDGVRDFEKSIRKTILKYEPRLKAVQVRFAASGEDRLALRFQITGRLATEDYKEPVIFQSVVGSDGKITLRR